MKWSLEVDVSSRTYLKWEILVLYGDRNNLVESKKMACGREVITSKMSKQKRVESSVQMEEFILIPCKKKKGKKCIWIQMSICWYGEVWEKNVECRRISYQWNKKKDYQLMLIGRDMELEVWGNREWMSKSSMALAHGLTREPQCFVSTKNLLNVCGHNLTSHKSTWSCDFL